MAHERRQFVEAAIRQAEAVPDRAEALARALEVSLEGEEWPRFVTVGALVLHLRAHRAADGRIHVGLFDPQGDPTDEPFRVSKLSW